MLVSMRSYKCTYYTAFVEGKLVVVMKKLVMFHTQSTTMNGPFSHSRSHFINLRESLVPVV